MFNNWIFSFDIEITVKIVVCGPVSVSPNYLPVSVP